MGPYQRTPFSKLRSSYEIFRVFFRSGFNGSDRWRFLGYKSAVHVGKWVFPKIGPPKWMVKIMENPIKMDDLGVPLFSETSKYINPMGSVMDLSLCSMDNSREPWTSGGIGPDGHVAFNCQGGKGRCFPAGRGSRSAVCFFDNLHPGRLTWNLTITQLKRKIIFQTIIFRFHVNLPGCSLFTFNEADVCNRLRLWPFCHHTFGPVELCFTSCCCGWFGWYWSGSKEVTWTAVKKRCSGWGPGLCYPASIWGL